MIIFRYNFQSSSIADELQQNSKRQRSLWATMEPSLPVRIQLLNRIFKIKFTVFFQSFESKLLRSKLSDTMNDE